ncbi:MAG: response regulator [Planctomycetaceae bacterium]
MPDDTLREMRILLVEDSPSDADLARRALERGEIRSQVLHAVNGEQALEMLHRTGRFTQCPRPDLVLLDLNMPRIDGRQVLQEVRSDESLRLIPVVVLTTSADERDINAVYSLGANSYIVKPVDLDQFFAVVECVQQYWFRVASLPQWDA